MVIEGPRVFQPHQASDGLFVEASTSQAFGRFGLAVSAFGIHHIAF